MSKIEWTQETWNPIVGCSVVSPGCTNCYAMRMAARIEAMGTQPLYSGLTRVVNGNPVWTGEVRLNEKKLLEPLKRKKPTTYFVNSMSDLFHASVPYEWIDKVFAVMALSPQHTYQVLTKRSARMRSYFEPYSRRRADGLGTAVLTLGYKDPLELLPWPVPNAWLGVSTEDQRRADERIPDLLATPAAVRFISAEPLLGPLDVRTLKLNDDRFDYLHLDALTGLHTGAQSAGQWSPGQPGAPLPRSLPGLDWVIVGGESGPGARPMHPDWARSLRDQCQAAGVPFFFKQWGEWRLTPSASGDETWPVPWTGPERPGPHEIAHMDRVGKRRAGRTLDGMIHDEYPQVRR